MPALVERMAGLSGLERRFALKARGGAARGQSKKDQGCGVIGANVFCAPLRFLRLAAAHGKRRGRPRVGRLARVRVGNGQFGRNGPVFPVFFFDVLRFRLFFRFGRAWRLGARRPAAAALMPARKRRRSVASAPKADAIQFLSVDSVLRPCFLGRFSWLFRFAFADAAPKPPQLSPNGHAGSRWFSLDFSQRQLD